MTNASDSMFTRQRIGIGAFVIMLLIGAVAWIVNADSAKRDQIATVDAATPDASSALATETTDAGRSEPVNATIPTANGAPGQPSPQPSQIVPGDVARQIALDLQQIHDPDKRREAIARIRELLESTEAREVLAGLMAIAACGADNELEQFYELVCGQLSNAEPRIRMSALIAFNATRGTRAELDRVLPLVSDKDPGVRSQLAFALRSLVGDVADPRALIAFESLLGDSDLSVVRQSLRAASTGIASVELEQKMLSMASDPRVREDVLALGLAPLQPKSTQVVSELIGGIQTARPETAATIVEYLHLGLSQHERFAAASRLATSLSLISSSGVRRECIGWVEHFGGVQDIPALTQCLNNPLLGSDERQAIEHAVSVLNGSHR
jgi:hypothetical protein